MRLAAYEDGKGQARLAVSVGQRLVDVGELPGDYPRGLTGDVLRDLERRAETGPDASVARYLPAVPRPGKVICVGRNYAAHAAETGFDVPTTPCLFAKFTSSLSGHEETVTPPRQTTKLDYEGELTVVIGRSGKDIPESEALSHIFGYTAGNDFSERVLQHITPTWLAGKGPDGFSPIGPWITTADEIPDPQAVSVRTRVNGETVQNGNTRDMVFPIAHIVAFASTLFRLEPGDVILTGTPDGVQFGKAEPRWLRAGDVVEVEVEGVGILRSRIGAWN